MPHTEGGDHGALSRRSSRLVTSGYYPHDDDAASNSSTGSTGQISYRESPVRVFKKKTGSRRPGGSSRASSRASSVSELQSPYSIPPVKADDVTGTGLVLSQRRGVAMRPMSSTVTPPRVEAPDFSSGYSSSEEGYYRSNLPNSSSSSSQSPAETGFRLRAMLTSPAHALSMLYWWLGTAWYSLTSGISLINVSLLSSRSAGVRKTILLLLLLLLLLFGIWYWYPYVTAKLSRSATRSPLVPPTHTHAPVRPPPDDKLVHASLLALRNEIYADLHEREAKWTESRAREMEDVLREINLLKQDGQKQKLIHEMLQTDLKDLRVQLKTVHSEHDSVIKEHLTEIDHRISELRSDMSLLRSSSELLTVRLDAQESQNAKLKAELSDWLLQQLSESDSSKQDVVMHPDLQRALEALEKKIMDRLRQEREKEKRDMWRTVGETLHEEGAGAVTIKSVEQIVHRALSLHRADGVGMADYALESSGASVINTRCSETYHTRTACLSLFGIPLWYHSESPRTVTQPELYPGKCWAFRGSEGFLLISLSYPVQITHVTLEHVPRVLSPTGNISSAPKDFAVYGMTKENAEHLGTFTYDQDGEPIQTFKHPDSPSEVYRVVELRILSNWGHPEYTCIYRFRVHGQPWTT
uniref:SUN domain-containing protein n=1 Tax=Pygocentrus nattereri TaxID=42514 RepID=A0AAR2JBU2_PYGNA